jgi:hypothetical protein
MSCSIQLWVVCRAIQLGPGVGSLNRRSGRLSLLLYHRQDHWLTICRLSPGQTLQDRGASTAEVLCKAYKRLQTERKRLLRNSDL